MAVNNKRKTGFKPGQSGNPKGRPKGAENKSTKRAREAIAAFVDGNSDRLQDWLDAIAADSPKEAFYAFLSLVEYHVPKLARSELTGPNGGPIEHAIGAVEWRIVKPKG